jgi:RNA polymerase sigma-70 factor, ECF subfamily
MEERSRGASGAAAEGPIVTALERGDHARAIELTIALYGPELLGYLSALTRDEALAEEAYARVSEELWKSLVRFRGECSLRTWSYKIAWRTAHALLREPYRRRGRRLSTTAGDALAASARTGTAPHQQTAARAWLAKARDVLSPEEQSLLTLRIDRRLSWLEVAEVMQHDAATLRKRFERVTRRLRRMAEEEGLLDHD